MNSDKEMGAMKILVVENEKNIRNLVSLYLQGRGYYVLEAENGKQAIEKIQQENPEIILLDMFMPVMNGKDVLIWLKKNKKYNAYISLMTAKIIDIGKIVAEYSNVRYVIHKPFDFAEVNNALEQMRKCRS
ncbi:MAG: response regulator [bacterium]|nr:response regulator [bacterium]